MAQNGRSNVVELGKAFFGLFLVFTEPADIQVIVSRSDVFACEFTEPPFFALILALGFAKWIFAKCLDKRSKAANE